MRLALALTLTLLALVAGASDVAVAATNDKGVLSMQPARRDLTGRPPLALSQTRISNSTQLTMNVTVFPTLLVQELDGSFTFNEDPRDLNAAKLMFGVGPGRFALKPNQTRMLNLRWRLLPREAKAAYLGLVVQGIPDTKGKGVGSVLRLLGINFFKLPGRFSVDGRLTGIRGEQAGPRVLRFFPRVKNTGQIHSQPRNGHCKVVDASGTVRVRELPFGAGVVLPGYEREYPVVVKKPNVLPAGSYVMKCAMRFGPKRSTRDYPFRLSGPNTLPTANLKLRSIGAKGEIGSAAEVTASIRNAGSKAADAVLKIRVDRIPIGKAPVLLARGSFKQGSVGAGDTKDATAELGELVAGNYRVTVVLSDGRTDLDEKTADFQASPKRGFFDKLKDSLLWLLLILAALLILFFLWRQRRKQKELEEELERTRQGHAAPAPIRDAAPPAPIRAEPPRAEPIREQAPPPPAPPPIREHAPSPAAPVAAADGRINVNTAAVEQLMQLPGVGRRAAERIVAHREANGPFGSLDDLKVIEGFHAERIARIAGSASV